MLLNPDVCCFSFVVIVDTYGVSCMKQREKKIQQKADFNQIEGRYIGK